MCALVSALSKSLLDDGSWTRMVCISRDKPGLPLVDKDPAFVSVQCFSCSGDGSPSRGKDVRFCVSIKDYPKYPFRLNWGESELVAFKEKTGSKKMSDDEFISDFIDALKQAQVRIVDESKVCLNLKFIDGKIETIWPVEIPRRMDINYFDVLAELVRAKYPEVVGVPQLDERGEDHSGLKKRTISEVENGAVPPSVNDVKTTFTERMGASKRKGKSAFRIKKRK
jgi:hypothetical protein